MKINESVFRDLFPPRTPSKVSRLLHRLCCGHSFNRFEAERALADHTLNSTISDLANDRNIKIKREWEMVPGYNDNPTRCIRYSIDTDPENLARSYWLLRLWGWRDSQLEIDFPPPEAA